MLRTFARTLPLCLAVAACGDDGSSPETETAGDTGAATSTGGGAGESTGEDATGVEVPTTGSGIDDAAVTYYRDAKSILDARCGQCHTPGNIAPFSLQTYEEAKMWADAILGSIDDGVMPPWPPDNACRSYAHDRSLTAEERETLQQWVDLGAHAGDPAEAPAPPEPPTPIDYTFELQMAEPYAPTIAPDEYRCFLLEWPEDEERFVTAFSVTPGERQIVHHVIAFAIPPAEAAKYQALDDDDPDPGYLCYGGPGGGGGADAARVPWLGAWVPGSNSGAMPEGTGLRVQPGSLIALQMHYHTYPGAEPDQSRVQFRTAPSVEREAVVMPFTNIDWVLGSEPMHLPAGEADVVHKTEADPTNFLPYLFPDGPFKAGDSFEIHNAALHMHTLGTQIKVDVVKDSGDECLLDIPRWDFQWQGNYDLTEKVRFEPGDRLRLECHWDNSAANQPFVDGAQIAPKDVYWGEGTGDEMCLAVLYISKP